MEIWRSLRSCNNKMQRAFTILRSHRYKSMPPARISSGGSFTSIIIRKGSWSVSSGQKMIPFSLAMSRVVGKSGDDGMFTLSVAALAATTFWYAQDSSAICESSVGDTSKESSKEQRMNAFEGVWWRRRPTAPPSPPQTIQHQQIAPEQEQDKGEIVHKDMNSRVRIACIGDSITYGVDSNAKSSAATIPQALHRLAKAAGKEHILMSTTATGKDTVPASNLLTAVTVAQVEQLWIETGMDKTSREQAFSSVPLKKKLATMAQQLNVDLGWGWPWPEQEIFPRKLSSTMPDYLESLLGGDAVECKNFGVSGATMMTRAHNPYTDRDQYQQALRYNPDIVVINLGFNDAIPANWDLYRASYVHDCLHMIDSFSNLDSKPTIFLCIPTLPQAMAPNYDDVISIRQSKGGLDNSIAAAASLRDVTLIHLEEVLTTEHYLDDRFHPNEQGLQAMANVIRAHVESAVKAKQECYKEKN
eukprot:m.855219 g.855219  ORF g.855219 m.855219 type:complete len:473 (+) comp23507_c0_seq4:258-1676(+)